MKKIILTLLLSFTPFLAMAAAVTDPSDIKVETINILPNSNFITTLSSLTTGVSGAYGLSEAKTTCHEWHIDPNKLADGVLWTIALEGSIDNKHSKKYRQAAKYKELFREDRRAA